MVPGDVPLGAIVVIVVLSAASVAVRKMVVMM